jgi:hypothetical protein
MHMYMYMSVCARCRPVEASFLVLDCGKSVICLLRFIVILGVVGADSVEVVSASC